jgi:hypothetical protein
MIWLGAFHSWQGRKLPERLGWGGVLGTAVACSQGLPVSSSPSWLRPHRSNPEAQTGSLGLCPAGLASLKLKSWLWEHQAWPHHCPKFPSSSPAGSLSHGPLASPWSDPVAWVHPMEPGSPSTALSSSPALFSLMLTAPLHIQLPQDPGFPLRVPAHPLVSASASQCPCLPLLATCTYPGLSPPLPQASLLFTILMIHRMQGHRTSEGPGPGHGLLDDALALPWRPLLLPSMEPGQGTPSLPRENSPFPSNWGFHPFSGAGRGGRRQRRCRLNKTMKRKDFLRAFLSGGSETITVGMRGHEGSRYNVGFWEETQRWASTFPGAKQEQRDPPCLVQGLWGLAWAFCCFLGFFASVEYGTGPHAR